MNDKSAAAWSTVLLLAIVACSGSESPSGGDASTGGSASAGTGGLGGATTVETTLTEPQIFKVLENIHASRVAEAAVATARATNEKVVAYAKSVSSAHEGAAAAKSA